MASSNTPATINTPPILPDFPPYTNGKPIPRDDTTVYYPAPMPTPAVVPVQVHVKIPWVSIAFTAALVSLIVGVMISSRVQSRS